MSHDYHQGPEGAVIFDGCAECDDRAANPLDGLLHLDSESFSTLENRMFDIEYRDKGHYLTDNEAKLGSALYRISVLNERYGGVMHA